MPDGIDLPEPQKAESSNVQDAMQEQIGALANIATDLLLRLQNAERRIAQLTKAAVRAMNAEGVDQEMVGPAPWVWYPPAVAPEDDPQAVEDPRVTISNFVRWYNATYVGLEGGRSRAIPDCWPQHAGLVMELGTLAYSWREANVGPDARAKEAQYWHTTVRPGFVDRVARDWLTSDCLDGQHHNNGAPGRADRFAGGEHSVSSRTTGQSEVVKPSD